MALQETYEVDEGLDQELNALWMTIHELAEALTTVMRAVLILQQGVESLRVKRRD